MNGANLTRDDAQTRGENITVDSYAVTLDLTTGPTTFATSSVVRFSAQPGSETGDAAP